MGIVRVGTWNMARAAARRGNDATNHDRWSYLSSLGLDVAFVQEASPPPPELATAWQVWPEPSNTDAWRTGPARAWATGIAVFNQNLELTGIPAIGLAQPLPPEATIFPPNAMRVSHPGSLAVALINGFGTDPTLLVSIYGLMDDPHLGSPRDRYATTTVQRGLSDLTPLIDAQRKRGVILGGDLNCGTQCLQTHPRAAENVAVFDRLRSLRFADCLADMVVPARGPLADCPCGPLPECRHVQTHRHPASHRPWQNDYMFVTEPLRTRVHGCAAIDRPDAWELSDHCPVVLELALA